MLVKIDSKAAYQLHGRSPSPWHPNMAFVQGKGSFVNIIKVNDSVRRLMANKLIPKSEGVKCGFSNVRGLCFNGPKPWGKK